MTERTIVADEVTCPKCSSTGRFQLERTEFDGADRYFYSTCAKCLITYKWKVVSKIESTEVQGE